jgi:hypothetical protein
VRERYREGERRTGTGDSRARGLRRREKSSEKEGGQRGSDTSKTSDSIEKPTIIPGKNETRQPTYY